MDGHVDWHELEEYIEKTHEIFKKHKAIYWSNIETFDRDMPWRFPAHDWTKLRFKFEVQQPFVEKFITFEAPHFLSPLSMFPAAHGLYHKYMEYIQNFQV